MNQFKILLDGEVKYEGDSFAHAVAYWLVLQDHYNFGLLEYFVNGVFVTSISNQI